MKPAPAPVSPLLAGAHVSIAGGIDRAVERAAEAGCRALQIFTKSSAQWRARELAVDEVRAFRARLRRHRIRRVVAHNSYLINLASPDRALWRRSVAAMVEELERCDALGVPGLICHPGAHMGAGVRAGVRRIVRGLDEVHRRTAGMRARVLLETAAGQGTTLGSAFSEIGDILRGLQDPDRVGACLDTCHAFAAGYDLESAEGWDATWDEFDREIGLARLEAIHVNDSRRERGSRVDRHASLGEGAMGLEPFRRLVNDRRLRGRPLILETPKSRDGSEDRRNLATLHRLVVRRRPATRRKSA